MKSKFLANKLPDKQISPNYNSNYNYQQQQNGANNYHNSNNTNNKQNNNNSNDNNNNSKYFNRSQSVSKSLGSLSSVDSTSSNSSVSSTSITPSPNNSISSSSLTNKIDFIETSNFNNLSNERKLDISSSSAAAAAIKKCNEDIKNNKNNISTTNTSNNNNNHYLYHLQQKIFENNDKNMCHYRHPNQAYFNLEQSYLLDQNISSYHHNHNNNNIQYQQNQQIDTIKNNSTITTTTQAKTNKTKHIENSIQINKNNNNNSNSNNIQSESQFIVQGKPATLMSNCLTSEYNKIEANSTFYNRTPSPFRQQSQFESNPKKPQNSLSSSFSSSTSSSSSSLVKPPTQVKQAQLISKPEATAFVQPQNQSFVSLVKMPQQPPTTSLPPPPPPSFGAKQLSKLKRFLTTLQQFAADISPETGDRVRHLVLNLVNSTISIEDFHSKLQEATNFPLRPFVIPFLRANLPLLQLELLNFARLSKLPANEFLNQNVENILLTENPYQVNSNHTHNEQNQFPSHFMTNETNTMCKIKRKSPDSNPNDEFIAPPPVKKSTHANQQNLSSLYISPPPPPPPPPAQTQIHQVQMHHQLQRSHHSPPQPTQNQSHISSLPLSTMTQLAQPPGLPFPLPGLPPSQINSAHLNPNLNNPAKPVPFPNSQILNSQMPNFISNNNGQPPSGYFSHPNSSQFNQFQQTFAQSRNPSLNSSIQPNQTQFNLIHSGHQSQSGLSSVNNSINNNTGNSNSSSSSNNNNNSSHSQVHNQQTLQQHHQHQQNQQQQHQHQHHNSNKTNSAKIDETNTSKEMKDKEKSFNNYMKDFEQDFQEILDVETIEDEFKNIDNMLNSIFEMVNKTKRMLASIQNKALKLKKQREIYELELRRNVNELKKGDSTQQLENRADDLKKKTDDVVSEVKRQAYLEMQKALNAAEQRASEILVKEREKFENVIKETKKQAQFDESNNRQEENLTNNCWNCGRKASETCSRCHQAKYCSEFCQHKHWELIHYKKCCSSETNFVNDTNEKANESQDKPDDLLLNDIDQNEEEIQEVNKNENSLCLSKNDNETSENEDEQQKDNDTSLDNNNLLTNNQNSFSSGSLSVSQSDSNSKNDLKN